MSGSSAVLSSTVRSPELRVASAAPTSAASAWVIPIAAKMTAKGSSPVRACAAICAASSRCGRPPTEKIGSFWPRTRVARPSIAETPVSTGSRGVSRCHGLIGSPATSRVSTPRTGGPPSSGSPRPLHTRPSQPSPTGMRSGEPVKATRRPSVPIPSVPSKTWTTARSSWTSSTTPWRTSPEARRISAISSQPTPATSPTTTSGPRTESTRVCSTSALTPVPPCAPAARRGSHRRRRRPRGRRGRAPARRPRSRAPRCARRARRGG